MPDHLDYCYACGYSYQPGLEEGSLICSCISSEERNANNGVSSSNGESRTAFYNDIDLIFGMELSTAKQFDRVKTAVLDAILDLLPPQVSYLHTFSRYFLEFTSGVCHI